MISSARGPVMLDVAGLELTAAERERIAHPLVGGLILFARNYAAPNQLKALTSSIRALRDPPPLIAVDHEGGRVQRFRNGFAALPAMRTLGEQWDRDAAAAAAEAERIGSRIAVELGAHGIDFSFTPVLDLDYGHSAVIGDRALHRNPNAVAHLAAALCRGLSDGGMAAVGKHFPGHGFVGTDSHAEIPVDKRPLTVLEKADLVPFGALVRLGIDGIMPAHVVFSAVDDRPAGFSSIWLQEVLRTRLGFAGLIFSDDLSMAGAQGAGDIVARAEAACAAGCDMVLVCNDPAAADALLSRWRPGPQPDLALRCSRMARRAAESSELWGSARDEEAPAR
ncbi:MAG TPA: beta-N-acetylhexosaminidase [Casimicrobiaceae bacterium]|jgi:beta-N-acetylhexosaminidase|nr:beta-N-acetylhexosaminidase [Casimicrobiaceae bacterium]